MADNNFGLDIGTRNIRISSLERRSILSEKNVIAVKDRKDILGYCDDAYEMFEKSPENVEVSFPVENSVVSNIKKEQLILSYLYKKINNGRTDKNSDFLVSVPYETTEVEKRAFYAIIASSKIKPRNISMIDQAIADSIACHMDVEDKNGGMVVNIGADTTDISVISNGGILVSRRLNIAGNQISESIINVLKSTQNKLIGLKMADQLKYRLCDLKDDAESRGMAIYGRHIATGLPMKTIVNSEIINKQVKETLILLTDNINILMEKIPLSIADTIMKDGIYLVGGTANLRNIDIYLRNRTGLSINILNDPASSTIRGITKVLSSPVYDHFRYYPEERIFE